MKTTGMRPLIALAALALPQAALAAPQPPIVAEAGRFMSAYAEDLKSGDRAAIAARYSGDGAYSLGWTAKKFQTHSQIVADYAGDWQKPAAFAWRDLSYEPIGKDAVMVIGGFDWDPGAGQPAIQAAYTAVLRREGKTLRIRLEHENRIAKPPAP